MFCGKRKSLMGYGNSHLCCISLKSFLNQVVVITVLYLANYNKTSQNSW